MSLEPAYSTDGHFVRRLSNADLAWLDLRARGEVAWAPVQGCEIDDLITYCRWLFARRGSMAEYAQFLFANGKIGLQEMQGLHALADWNQDDVSYVVWDRHDNPNRCCFWRIKDDGGRA